MGITVYPSPNYPRRETDATLDSLGRVYLHGNVELQALLDNVDCSISNAERYDPATGVWTILAQPPKKLYQTAWILDSADRYIGMGWVYETLGTCGQTFNIPDSFMYDPATDSWTTLASSPYFNGDSFQPAPRLVSPWKYAGQLYILENVGPNVTRPFQHFTGGPTGTWVSGVATPSTQPNTNEIENPYSQANPVGANGLFLFVTGPGPGSVVYTYNPLTDAFSTTSAPPTGANAAPTTQQWDGTRYVHYISGGPGASDSIRYDSLTDTWSSYPGAGTLITQGISAVLSGFADISGNFVALFGYQTTDKVYHPNILVYDFTLGHWLDTGDALSVIRLASVVHDPTGGGVYLVEGHYRATPVAFELGATQTFEYWLYNGTPPPAIRRHPRSWATFIGAD